MCFQMHTRNVVRIIVELNIWLVFQFLVSVLVSENVVSDQIEISPFHCVEARVHGINKLISKQTNKKRMKKKYEQIR